jgi:hypothetical protein
MPVELKEAADRNLLEVRLTGKLVRQDYESLAPVVECLIKRHRKIRMRVDMHDFHGWTAGALWEDCRFALHHFRDIKRLALVGERKWQAGMAVFCKPFTTAKIRYFEHAESEKARDWLDE